MLIVFTHIIYEQWPTCVNGLMGYTRISYKYTSCGFSLVFIIPFVFPTQVARQLLSYRRTLGGIPRISVNSSLTVIT